MLTACSSVLPSPSAQSPPVTPLLTRQPPQAETTAGTVSLPGPRGARRAVALERRLSSRTPRCSNSASGSATASGDKKEKLNEPSASKAADLCRRQAGSELGQLALRSFLSAPDHAAGEAALGSAARPRPASAKHASG